MLCILNSPIITFQPVEACAVHELLARLAPGIVWIAAFLSMLLGLDRLFREGRTFNHYLDKAVGEDEIRAIWDLMKMPPTSTNQSQSV